MLSENPAKSAQHIRTVMALCDHFTGKALHVTHSETETLTEARQYAVDLLQPDGLPHLWQVQVEIAPGEWRTLATTDNAKHGEVTARFIAYAAFTLPKILAEYLAVLDAEADQMQQQAELVKRLSEQMDELSMEAICYDI